MIRRPQFIVNPNASGGACGRIWDKRIAPHLNRAGVSYDAHRTQAPGDAARLAAELAPQAATILSVGGDGTHNETTSGLWRAGLPRPNLRVGFLTLGTGGDFRKTLQLPPDPLAQLSILLADLEDRRTVPVDLGKLSYVDHEDQAAERAFLNIASFGIGGEVDDRVNRTTKALGGFTSFLIGSVRATLGYRNRTVQIAIDGQDTGEFKVFNVAVANGRYFGGGMHVAPEARPDDGLFDVVVMGDLNFVQKLRMAPKLYRGAHLLVDRVHHCRARVVEASSNEVVLLDVDGEQPGRLPARFEIVPEALQVLGARFDQG